MPQVALKRRRIGQDTDTSRALLRIGASQGNRVEVETHDPGGGRCLLDLGNDLHTSCFQGSAKVPDGRQVGDASLQRCLGNLRPGSSDLFRFVRDDSVQNGGHRCLLPSEGPVATDRPVCQSLAPTDRAACRHRALFMEWNPAFNDVPGKAAMSHLPGKPTDVSVSGPEEVALPIQTQSPLTDPRETLNEQNPDYLRPPAPCNIAELILVVFLYFLWPTVCQEALSGLGVYSWYYGPELVKLAQEKPSGDSQANDTQRTEQSRLARGRMQLWLMVLAAPLQVLSIPATLFLLRRTPPQLLGLTMRGLGRYLLVGVGVWLVVTPAVLLLHYLVQSLYKEVFQIVPEEHALQLLAVKGELRPWEWTLWFSAAIVVAPIVEELLFRGIMQPWIASQRNGPEVALGLSSLLILLRWKEFVEGWLQGGLVRLESLSPILFVLLLIAGLPLVRRWRPECAAVWGSSALFAMFHVSVWPSPVPLFLLALALGECFRRTGSLVGPIVIHGLFNGTSIALFFLGLTSGS
jgi:membrane protease YdiL (CAAX protease family)